MIVIDYKDVRPIYEQVVDRFCELILKGVLKTDEQLPSVRSLAIELSINPNTIQKAYMELERMGYIYSVKGRGNFVSNSTGLLFEQKEKYLEKIATTVNEALEYGVLFEDIIERINECRR